MYCVHCANELPEGSEFCEMCGSNSKPEPIKKPAPPTHQNSSATYVQPQSPQSYSAPQYTQQKQPFYGQSATTPVYTGSLKKNNIATVGFVLNLIGFLFMV